jgi:hypothetical protein
MRLLKNKSFRLLVWATIVSSFGDSLYALAITLSVYELSGSLAGVGYAMMGFGLLVEKRGFQRGGEIK